MGMLPVGMQRVVGGHMDQPHPLASIPGAAPLDFEPPVVVAVADPVLAEGGDLLLAGDGGGVAGMAVQVASSQDVLEADHVAVAYGLAGVVVVWLAVWTLDAPEVVVV